MLQRRAAQAERAVWQHNLSVGMEDKHQSNMPADSRHPMPHCWLSMPPSRAPYLAIVLADLNDLWRHPMRRADEGVALAHCVGQLRRHPKVGQLHLARLGQQNIAALDVAVHLGGTEEGGEQVFNEDCQARVGNRICPAAMCVLPQACTKPKGCSCELAQVFSTFWFSVV